MDRRTMKTKERFKAIWSLLFSSKLIDDLQQKLDHSESQRIEEEKRFRSKFFERLNTEREEDFLYVYPDHKVDLYEKVFTLSTKPLHEDFYSRAIVEENHYALEQIRSSLLFCDGIERGTETALQNLTKLLYKEGYFDVQVAQRSPGSASISISLRMYKRI